MDKFTVKKPPSKSPITNVDESDSILNFFDATNPDIDLFNLIDDETIRISGSKIALYKYYPSQEFDDVYTTRQKLDEAIQALNECNDILDELLATGRIYLNHVSNDAS